MQLPTLLAASLLAIVAPASAAPSAAAVKSMTATDVPAWIMQSVRRVCDAGDTTCTWTFAVNTQTPGVAPVHCSYPVPSRDGKPASLSSGGPVPCGDRYTITSGVSQQWVPSFTTFSVVDNDRRMIIWPAYTETQVKDGKVVVPDQSYAPQALP